MSHFTPITLDTIKKLREEAAKKREEKIYQLKIEKSKRKWEGVRLVYEKAMAMIQADPDASVWRGIDIIEFKADDRYLEPDVFESILEELHYVFPVFTIIQDKRLPWSFQFVLKEC